MTNLFTSLVYRSKPCTLPVTMIIIISYLYHQLAQRCLTSENYNSKPNVIQVAGGSVLPLRQDDLKLTGHSFEARIYAEDPKNDFMPGAGRLTYLSPPPTDDTIRVETGVRQGKLCKNNTKLK